MLRKFPKKVSRDTQLSRNFIIFRNVAIAGESRAAKCDRNAEKRTEIAAGRPKVEKHEDVYARYFRKKIAGRDRRALRDGIKDEEASVKKKIRRG